MQCLRPNCNREGKLTHGTAPVWAVMLAVLLQDHSPEALTIALEEARQEIAAADPEPPARSAQT